MAKNVAPFPVHDRNAIMLRLADIQVGRFICRNGRQIARPRFHILTDQRNGMAVSRFLQTEGFVGRAINLDSFGQPNILSIERDQLAAGAAVRRKSLDHLINSDWFSQINQKRVVPVLDITAEKRRFAARHVKIIDRFENMSVNDGKSPVFIARRRP